MVNKGRFSENKSLCLHTIINDIFRVKFDKNNFQCFVSVREASYNHQRRSDRATTMTCVSCMFIVKHMGQIALLKQQPSSYQ